MRIRETADVEAWSEFDGRYRELILRHCRTRGLQAADADDVRQLVMLSLAKALRSFRYDPAQGRFRDYLGRVVHNAIQRHLERASRKHVEVDVHELDMLVTDAGSADERWETDWMHHHMLLAMVEVKKTSEPVSIEVFERLVAGEPAASVASACGKSEEAVKKILQRVRERLREQVARQIRDEDLHSV